MVAFPNKKSVLILESQGRSIEDLTVYSSAFEIDPENLGISASKILPSLN
jgi:hypothetical protein